MEIVNAIKVTKPMDATKDLRENDNRLEIYKIESLGALDGPGLRTVVFLQGCPLRCAYCHNADSWQIGKGVMIDEEALFAKIMRYKSYYKRTGGVTFSGGEPLLQANALIPLVHRLREAGVHVALDTSGCIVDEASQTLIEAVDLVILDIKANDESGYIRITGQGIEKPLKTLMTIRQLNKPYWIRQVILKNVNDNLPSILKLEALTHGENRIKIELLPYHELGADKWDASQLLYKGVFETPDSETMQMLELRKLEKK